MVLFAASLLFKESLSPKFCGSRNKSKKSLFLIVPPSAMHRERQFHGAVAACLGDAMHTVVIVLVAAIKIAVDNVDDGAKT